MAQATGESLYSFRIQVTVKNYKGQTKNTAVTFDPFQVNCRDVLEFKTILWNRYSNRLERKAVINPEDDTIPYAVAEEESTIDDAGLYSLICYIKKVIGWIFLIDRFCENDESKNLFICFQILLWT
jgi:hypothetical protein